MKYSCRYLISNLNCCVSCAERGILMVLYLCHFSLLCVKKHKLALSCNGIRDKTSFISVNEFTDLNLLSGKNIPCAF